MVFNYRLPNIRTLLLSVFIILTLSNICLSAFSNDYFKTIYISLGDGTKLATDLYFPQTGSNKFPVVLMRTPYNKNFLKSYGEFYSSHGYIVAIQDVRGKYASEGKWHPYKNEGKDGYETVEWLSQQDWSSGKIGMVGGSYSGSVQLAAAIENPPHLVTIIPNITPATPYNNTPYENGVFALGWAIRWSDITEKDITGQEMNQKFQKVFQTNWYDELNHLPVIDIDKKIIGKEIDFWRNWIYNKPDQCYWDNQDYLEKLYKVQIPVFLQSGWFDVANRGTKLIYKSLNESGNNNVKLIIGPWVHSDKSSKTLGGLYLGEEAGIDIYALYVKWFDYWLKGIDNGILNDPMVQIFNIGPNNWIYSEKYPLSETKKTRLFLSGGKNENSKGKFGTLLSDNLNTERTFTSYTYDPSSPTPGFTDYMKKNKIEEYQKIIESRSDVIIFETPLLKDSMMLAGPLSAVIYASSSAVDTDFSVTVTGVNSDGNIFPIGQTFGIVRAKYRNSSLKEELMEKDTVYQFNIDLSHTGYTLAPGERLRLEVSSCFFPEFSRNLNTGKNNQTSENYISAKQRIYHNNKYPSHIIFHKIEH